jgi:hypothetical protein
MNAYATHPQVARQCAARGDLGASAERLRRRWDARLLRPLDARRRHPRRRGRVRRRRHPARAGSRRVARIGRRAVRQPRGRHHLLAGAGPRCGAGAIGLRAVLARDLPVPVRRRDRADPQPHRPDAVGHAGRRPRRRPCDRRTARLRDGVRRGRWLAGRAVLGERDEPRVSRRGSRAARRDRQRRRARRLADRSPLGDPGRRDHRARDGGCDLHDGPGRRRRRRHRRRPDRHRHGGLHLGRRSRAARPGQRATQHRRSRPVRPGRVRGARAHGARALRAVARQRGRGRPRRHGARARAGADGRGAAREPRAARQQPHRGRHRPVDRAEQPAQPRDRAGGCPARGRAPRPPAARPQRLQGLQRQLRPWRGRHPAPPARRGARAGRRPRCGVPHRRRRVLRARAARRRPRGVLRALRGGARHPRGRLLHHGRPRGCAVAGGGPGTPTPCSRSPTRACTATRTRAGHPPPCSRPTS